MKYYLDTNIFIEGYKAYYPMDVFPSYWNVLKDLIRKGTFVIIDKVWDEIQDKELQDWMSACGMKGLVESTVSSFAEYAELQSWAYGNSQFSQMAKDAFADTNHADAYLVAHAKHEKGVVVTYEVSAKDSRKTIKIPEACQFLGVQYMKIVPALRELGISI